MSDKDTDIGTDGEADSTTSNNNSGEHGATDGSTSNQNDQAGNTYTQQQVDGMMAEAKRTISLNATKKFNDLGDYATLKGLVEGADKAKQKSLIDKGKYNDALAHVVETKDATIASQAKELRELKVNDPLLKAASAHRSYNPEQTVKLLTSNVNLTSDGSIEVTDDNGNVRFDDNGKNFTVDALVQEFMVKNPHFQHAGKTTSNSNSSHDPAGNLATDLDNLVMSNDEDRAVYKEWRKQHGMK